MAALTWLILLLVTLITFIVYKWWSTLNYWQSRGIPCDPPHLFFGNLYGVQFKRTFADAWRQCYRKYKGSGPFVGFYWFQRPAAFILDIELVKNVLIRDFAKFSDRGLFSNERDDPLSGQLFALDGHKWKFMRSKLSPTFTSGKMKFMFSTVVQVGHEFVKAFDEILQKTSVVEVKELLARFTTDVIGTCAFGIDCNSLKDPEAEFRIMGKKIFTDLRHDRIRLGILFGFPKLASRLRMKQTPDHIESFFMRIVQETVKYREKNNMRRNDFMDMLIDLKNNKTMNSELDKEMRGLTIGEIAAQAYVFFTAGFETSSTTLGFLLYELAKNEDIQQRVREEVITVLQKHNNEFTYDCMKEFTYMGQVISETLRLYTILPVLNRECIEDYVVPGHPNYVIEKGTMVLIPNADIHRDPEYYPNPEVFNPDNYSPENIKNRDSILWLAFGEGPRNCIGMRFALMEMRIALVFLIKNYTFSVCEETPNTLLYDKMQFIVSSVGGIPLKVQKI